MSERLANIGYLALKKQTAEGTVAIPNDYIPLYKESISTILNLVSDTPIVGLAWQRYQSLQGQRGHHGQFTVMAEPNTAAKLFDMLMTKGNVSGVGPYTWPYTTDVTTTPYTIDISTGNQVFRFWDARLGQITESWNQTNEMNFDCDLSALHSWGGRALVGVPTGTNPWTLSFDTTYDPSPTTGLVVGDTLQVQKAAGGTINITVATIVNATDITTTTADPTSAVAGDFVIIRPATPSFTLLTPFLWSRSEFRFGTTASAALSATHTPLEVGSQWTIMNKFENAEGSKRSGSFDPAALPRVGYDATFKVKKLFDTNADYAKFLAITKQACVIRHFSGTGYELRITLNNLKAGTSAKPHLQSTSILYSDIELVPQYDTSDSQAIDVKVLNNLASF